MIKQGEFDGHWDDRLLRKRFPLHLESTRQQFFRNATCVIVNTSILDISFVAAGQVGAAAPLVFRQFVGQFLYGELFLAAEIANPFLGRVPVQ